MGKWRVVIVLGSTLGASPLVACTMFSDTYIESHEAEQVSGKPDAGSGATPTSAPAPTGAQKCSGGAFTKPDLASLAPCGGGKGHCFSKTRVTMGDELSPCADPKEVCVPDEILRAGGDKLASCKSIVGPGACVTGSLFPELVAQGGGALSQDVCAAGQMCVPCTDPRNGASTGMCDPTGVLAQDCAGGPASGPDASVPAAPLAKCCTTNGTSNGVCIAETAIPEDQRDDAKADTCSAGNKCVPAAFVEGRPVTCDSGLLGKGVCMDRCFDDMLGFAGSIGILTAKGCGSTEVCVPCSFVSGEGVPGCS